jgi:hypothetical protein
MILIPIAILLFILVIGYFATRGYFNRQYLRKNGIPTGATVVSVTKTNAETTNTTELPKRIYEIDFGITADNEPYRLVTVRRAFAIGERIPEEGDFMALLIDPKNPNNAMISPWQNRGD